MAGRGAVLLLLTVLAATLTRNTSGQDLRAPQHELKDLVAEESLEETWEARGKELPEEVEAKVKILKKRKEGKREEIEEVKKEGKRDDIEKKVNKKKKGKEEKNKQKKKDKEEGKRKQNEKRKRKKRTRKACPGGRCVASSERCGSGRAVRAASCKSGVCCVSASKRTEEDPEERHRKCKPRKPCRKVWGQCMSKKTGCPSGQTMLVSSKKTKYCSRKSCVCCTDEKPMSQCESKKCDKKKGFCTTDKKECPGKIKVSKSFCSGDNCVCCLPVKPPKPCKTNHGCTKKGGTCVDLKHGHCKTKPHVGKEYCKGNKCGCCIPEEDAITTTTTTAKPPNPNMWSYHGNTGPDFWALTSPLCNGVRQSPIDFKLTALETKWMNPFVLKNYDVVPTTTNIENNGHAVVFTVEMPGDPPQFTGGGLNGTYIFRQAHLHWGMTSDSGSEHTMNSKSEPAELHLVHYKADYGSILDALDYDDGLGVLGVMIELGDQEHPLFKLIAPYLEHIIEPKTNVDLPTSLPLMDYLPKDLSIFYRYKGSLTTPPCLERVIWTVFKDTIFTNNESMAPFHKLKDVHMKDLSGNYRPIQEETEFHEPCIVETITN